jgi:hypothetical protein
MSKHKVDTYFDSFVSSATFPSKAEWKVIVRSSVKTTEEVNLNYNSNDPKLECFSNVYGKYMRTHPIWSLENITKGNRKYLRDFAKLNGVLKTQIIKNCVYCNKHFSDYLNHYMHNCTKYEDTREHFWTAVINEFSVNFCVYLYNLSDSEITQIIFGQTPTIKMPCTEQIAFLKVSAEIWQILTYERELIFY